MKLNILNIMDLPPRITIWLGTFSLIKERPFGVGEVQLFHI